MPPRSLLDVWNLFQHEIQDTQPKQKAHVTLALTKTALLRYTLPGWGSPVAKRHKLTEWETQSALKFMQQVTLEQLSEALSIQQEVFEKLQVPNKSQRTYRAALNKLLEWCKQQSWWLTAHSTPSQTLTGKSKHQGLAQDVRQTDRKHRNHLGWLKHKSSYGLGSVKDDVITNRLREELDAFKAFRTDPNCSYPRKAVKQSTVDKELRYIHRILGWLHRVKEVPTEELSLRQIVPSVGLTFPKDNEELSGQAWVEAEKAVLATAKLIQDYLNWLRADPQAKEAQTSGRGIKSPHTESDVFKTLIAVAHFINYQEALYKGNSKTVHFSQDAPIFEWLQKELSLVTKASKRNQRKTLQITELPTWLEILAVVEQLRAKCNQRLKKNSYSTKKETLEHPSSLQTTAFCYQRFLLLALMTYIPPQRQQIYRHLAIRGSQNSQDQKLGSFSKPASGYIYKEANYWYIHLLKDEYKTAKTYSECKIAVPNIQYPDGRCFYQYLEEWLVEYTYPIQGEATETIEGLRQVFTPNHDYFFSQSNTKAYAHPTNFSALVFSSFQIIDKYFNLDDLRHIFVEYVLNRGVTGAELQSLAIETGYSLKLLYKTYDVYMDIQTIRLGSKIAQEVAQNFVNQDS